MSSGARNSIVEHWNAFWFAEVTPDVYAVLRILFGILGGVSLLGMLDLPLFWSCDGLIAARNTSLCASFNQQGGAWMPGYAILVFAATSLGAMVVGFYTRAAVWSAFVSVFLVARWNDLPLSAAHQVLRSVLFCLLWADCGATWSIDSFLKQRRTGRQGDRTGTVWPLQLLRIQVAVVYLVTGLWKLDNIMWRNGSALHYVFENPQFRRFSALGLPGWDPWTTAATYATLVWELAFAFLVMHPKTRRWALATGVLMHLGMWLVLELGPFSWVMLASYVAFLDPESVRRRLTVLDRATVGSGLVQT